MFKSILLAVLLAVSFNASATSDICKAMVDPAVDDLWTHSKDISRSVLMKEYKAFTKRPAAEFSPEFIEGVEFTLSIVPVIIVSSSKKDARKSARAVCERKYADLIATVAFLKEYQQKQKGAVK